MLQKSKNHKLQTITVVMPFICIGFLFGCHQEKRKNSNPSAQKIDAQFQIVPNIMAITPPSCALNGGLAVGAATQGSSDCTLVLFNLSSSTSQQILKPVSPNVTFIQCKMLDSGGNLLGIAELDLGATNLPLPITVPGNNNVPIQSGSIDPVCALNTQYVCYFNNNTFISNPSSICSGNVQSAPG